MSCCLWEWIYLGLGIDSLVVEQVNQTYEFGDFTFGLIFDSGGLLWSITSLLQKPLKSYNPSSNQWRSYDFSDIINNPINDNLGFNDIVIDPSGTKFIASFSKGLIL